MHDQQSPERTKYKSRWRHSGFIFPTNFAARDCSAVPAGDSGNDSKMFEPCSQQTHRFYEEEGKNIFKKYFECKKNLRVMQIIYRNGGFWQATAKSKNTVKR